MTQNTQSKGTTFMSANTEMLVEVRGPHHSEPLLGSAGGVKGGKALPAAGALDACAVHLAAQRAAQLKARLHRQCPTQSLFRTASHTHKQRAARLWDVSQSFPQLVTIYIVFLRYHADTLRGSSLGAGTVLGA